MTVDRIRRNSINLMGVLIIAGIGVSFARAESGDGAVGALVPDHVHGPADGATICGYRSPEKAMAEFQLAIDRGEIVDPKTKKLPQFAPRVQQAGGPLCVPTPTTNDFFPFEDSAGTLLTNFSDGQLTNIMVDATNALLTAEGDNFDFVAFWVNFTPDHTIGAAFYQGLENTNNGIGQGTFNQRAGFGVGGVNVEGWVMMWNINSSFWQPGTGSNADFTRLVLGQEFEHRWAMFLPPLADGRQLQGNNGSCGRGAHWNFKVDGQGSGMEIREWIGSNPAIRFGGSLTYNQDIDPANAVFSYTDLYLMGYVTPAEMDAGNSELRYLNDNNSCTSNYNGTITGFTASDIVATAGTRTPASPISQRHFRTGWIILHQPGDLPSAAELNKATGITSQWTDNWNLSTLGRGTMNNSFRASCSPDIEWTPVSADMANTISGNNITVAAGGAQVTLEMNVANWTPNLLLNYQGQVDSAGYTSGDTGSLSPLTAPNASAGAFIDTARGDYVFNGVANLDAVDTSSLNYRWGATLLNAGDSVSDTGPKYAGTLVLDVSPDAQGTFTVGFNPDPNQSFLTDNNFQPIAPVNLTPATISIVPANTMCSGANAITCDTSVTFDNSSISGGPSPSYACGFGTAHDGTLWFKFTATDTSARISSCNSIAQDSTFAIYDGGCGVLNQLACSEDDCGASGFLGDQTITGLTIGNEYLIQFSAFDSSTRGTYTIDLSCAVIQASAPAEDPAVPDGSNGTANRYLSFLAGDAGRQQVVEVTFVSMPPGFEGLVGQTMWLGNPVSVSENSGIVDPANAPAFPSFTAVPLSCSPTAADWSQLGALRVFGEAIVPGATYELRVVDANQVGNPAATSSPFTIRTSIWGDLVQDCATIPCGPPNGIVGVPTDVVAVLDKFSNLASGPIKARIDVDPAVPDRIINVGDTGRVLDSFSGASYPFAAPTPCP